MMSLDTEEIWFPLHSLFGVYFSSTILGAKQLQNELSDKCPVHIRENSPFVIDDQVKNLMPVLNIRKSKLTYLARGYFNCD